VRVLWLWSEVALRRGGIHHLHRALAAILALAAEPEPPRAAPPAGEEDVLGVWASFDGGWAGGRGCPLWEPTPAMLGPGPGQADPVAGGAGGGAGRDGGEGEGAGEEALWDCAERAATTLLRELVRSHVAQRNAQGDRYKALFRAALSGHVQSPPLRRRRLLAVLRDLHAQLPARPAADSDDQSAKALRDGD
jgi:hypothetical protein